MKSSKQIITPEAMSSIFLIKIGDKWDNPFTFGDRIKIFAKTNSDVNMMLSKQRTVKEFITETFKIPSNYYDQLFDAYSKIYN